MFSHKVFLEGCTNKLRKICDEFVENAMQDDLGQKLKSEALEEMLKIAHDLENLEDDTQNTKEEKSTSKLKKPSLWRSKLI
ncbi:hypothetical protein NP05261_01550 [Helicobacter pylori]